MNLIFDILKIGQLVEVEHPNRGQNRMLRATIIDVVSPTQYKVESNDVIQGYEVKLTYWLLTEYNKYKLIK